MKEGLYKFCPCCQTELVQKSINNTPRLACPACGWIRYVDPKVAAGVLVSNLGKVLLIQRHFPPHAGTWSIPAGFMEAGEEPDQTAERECLEETGLKVRITGLLRMVTGRAELVNSDLFFIYTGEVVGGELHPQDDADGAGFFGPDELPEIAFPAIREVVADLYNATYYGQSPAENPAGLADGSQRVLRVGAEAGVTAGYAAYDGYLTRMNNWKSTVIMRIPDNLLHPGQQVWAYFTHMTEQPYLFTVPGRNE